MAEKNSSDVMQEMFERQVQIYSKAMENSKVGEVIDSNRSIGGHKIGYSIAEDGQMSFYQMLKDGTNRQLDLTPEQVEEVKSYLLEGNAYSRFRQNKKNINSDKFNYSNVQKTNSKAPETKEDYKNSLNSKYLGEKGKELKARQEKIEKTLAEAVGKATEFEKELQNKFNNIVSSGSNLTIQRNGSFVISLSDDQTLVYNKSISGVITFNAADKDGNNTELTFSEESKLEKREFIELTNPISKFENLKEFKDKINQEGYTQEQYEKDHNLNLLPKTLEEAKEVMDSKFFDEASAKAEESKSKLLDIVNDKVKQQEESKSQTRTNTTINLLDANLIEDRGEKGLAFNYEYKDEKHKNTYEKGILNINERTLGSAEKVQEVQELYNQISEFEGIKKLKERINDEKKPITEQEYKVEAEKYSSLPADLETAKQSLNSNQFDEVEKEIEVKKAELNEMLMDAVKNRGKSAENKKDDAPPPPPPGGAAANLSDVLQSLKEEAANYKGSNAIYFDGIEEPDVYLEKGKFGKNEAQDGYRYHYLDEDNKLQNAIVALEGEDNKEVKARAEELIADITAVRSLDIVRQFVQNENATEAMYDAFRSSQTDLNLPDNLEAARDMFKTEEFSKLQAQDKANRQELRELVKERSIGKGKAQRQKEEEIPELKGSLRDIINRQTLAVSERTPNEITTDLEEVRGFKNLKVGKSKSGDLKFIYDRGKKGSGEVEFGNPEEIYNKMSKDRALTELKAVKEKYYNNGFDIPVREYEKMRKENNYLPKDQDKLKELLNGKQFVNVFRRNGEFERNKDEIALETSRSLHKQKTGLSTGAKIGLGIAGASLIALDAFISVGVMGQGPHIMQAVSGLVSMYVNYEQNLQINALKSKQNAEDALKDIRTELGMLKGMKSDPNKANDIDGILNTLGQLGLKGDVLEKIKNQVDKKPSEKVLNGEEARLNKDKSRPLEEERARA